MRRKGGGMLCEETKTAAAEISMSRAGPAMTSFICRDLGALMESNNNYYDHKQPSKPG